MPRHEQQLLYEYRPDVVFRSLLYKIVDIVARCTSQVINSQRIKCSACGVSYSGSPSFVCIKHSSVHSTIYVPSISSLTDKLHHQSLHISLPHAFTLKLCTHYPAHPTIHHNLTNQQAVQLQTFHLQPLTTALAFLMLGTSSDSDTTYNWLRRETPCTGTPLNPICSIQFTVPSGGANFDYQGYNNHVPYNLPAWNDRNYARDATCALLSERSHFYWGSDWDDDDVWDL